MRIPVPVRLLVALLALAAPAARAQEATLLRYRLHAGESHRYVATTETRSSATLEGMEQTSTQVTTQSTRWDVLDVSPDGTTRLSVTTDAVRAAMDGSGGHLEYDSSRPAAPVPAPFRALAALVGSSITITLAADGSVQGVEGWDDLVERVLAGLALPPGPAADGARDEVRRQFGEEGIGASLMQSFATYPAEPVSVGTSWSAGPMRMPAVPVTAERTFTVTGRRDGVVSLAVRSVLASDSASVVRLGGLTQRFELAGEATGTVEVEESTGLQLRAASEGTLSGSVTTTGPMGTMRMPLSVHTVTTVERREEP